MMRSVYSTILALLVGAGGLNGQEQTPVADLIRQLGDDDIALREKATEALIDVGTTAVEPLKAARSSDDAEVRIRSTKILRVIEIKGWLPAGFLKKSPKAPWEMASSDVEQKCAILKTLSKTDDNLEYVEGNVEESIARIAGVILADHKGLDAEDPTVVVDTLSRAMPAYDDGHCPFQPEVATALERPLLDLLKREEGWIRQSAVHVLGKIGSRNAIPGMIAALKDNPGSEEAETILGALASLEAEEAVPDIVKLVAEKGGWSSHQSRAVDILAELNAREAIPAIAKLLDHQDPAAVADAMGALARLKATGSIPKIYKILKKNEETTLAAMEALADLGSTEAIPLILPYLEKSEAHVRYHALRALDKLKSKETVQAAKKMIVDADGMNRGLAAVILIERGDPPKLLENILEGIKILARRGEENAARVAAVLKAHPVAGMEDATVGEGPWFDARRWCEKQSVYDGEWSVSRQVPGFAGIAVFTLFQKLHPGAAVHLLTVDRKGKAGYAGQFLWIGSGVPGGLTSLKPLEKVIARSAEKIRNRADVERMMNKVVKTLGESLGWMYPSVTLEKIEETATGWKCVCRANGQMDEIVQEETIAVTFDRSGAVTIDMEMEKEAPDDGE